MDEKLELAKLSSRELRNAAASLAGALWLSGMVLQPFSPRHEPVRNWQLWLLIGLAALYFCGRIFLRWHRLKKDRAEDLVVKVKEKDGQEIEFLPASGLVWSLGGKPVPWRTN